MASPTKALPPRKLRYRENMLRLWNAYDTLIIIDVDHVGSKQLADIRKALVNMGTILMGKNTTMKKILGAEPSPRVDLIMPMIRKNVGLLFCDVAPEEIKRVVELHKVPAPARQGVVAPVDVFIPAGATGMDPSQTSFFQAMGISTKIVKGQIEIQNDVHMVKEGERVTASAATLLQKLNIKPFFYGLKMKHVFQDGSLYDASVMDITDDYIVDRVTHALQMCTEMSLGAHYITSVSAPHVMRRAFKMCAAFALGIGYEMSALDVLKNAAASSAAAAASAASAPGAPAKAAPVKEESESDDDVGFSLFD